jgi:hypothetical protein
MRRPTFARGAPTARTLCVAQVALSAKKRAARKEASMDGRAKDERSEFWRGAKDAKRRADWRNSRVKLPPRKIRGPVRASNFSIFELF